MDDKELFELAKKFGDEYTYGKIVEVLKDKFIDKQKVNHIIKQLETACALANLKEGLVTLAKLKEELGLNTDISKKEKKQ